MALTLQNMVNFSLLNSTTAANGASAKPALSSQSAQALDIASKRISAQVSATNVKLSSYGQIQSGFSSLQTAGKALTTLPANATTGDVSKAVQSFVDAYNTTNSAIATGVNGTGKTAGALASDPLVRLSGNDLRRVATSTTGLTELKNIGITVSQNGSLSVDSKVLGNALQANPDAVKSTLAKLGQQAAATATHQLSNSGDVGKSVSLLSTQSKNLAAVQTQQQSLVTSAQTSMQLNANVLGGASGSSGAIGAYMKIFST
jgi:flagellar capping protein FliD